MSDIIIFFCQIFDFAVCNILPTLMFTEGCTKCISFFLLFLKQPQFEFLYLGSYENWTALVLELMFHQLGTTLMTISAQQQDQTPTLATQAAF